MDTQCEQVNDKETIGNRYFKTIVDIDTTFTDPNYSNLLILDLVI